MTDVLEMLTLDYSEAEQRAEQNRIDFPFVAEWLDVLKAAGIDARCTYARNGDKKVGECHEDKCKRDGLVECMYLPYGVRQ